MTMMGVYTKKTSVTGTTSNPVDSEGGVLVGVYIPASMASTVMYVDVSDDGSTFSNVFDSTGSRLSMTISTTARYVLVPQSALPFGGSQVRIVTGSTENAVPLTLVFQRVS